MKTRQFASEDFVGKTVTDVTLGDETTFECDDGSRYRIIHEQDCCEVVRLMGNRNVYPKLPFVVIAFRQEEECGEDDYESYTKTLITIETNNGYLNLEWYGTSNGYYGEGVSFQKMEEDGCWTSFIGVY